MRGRRQEFVDQPDLGDLSDLDLWRKTGDDDAEAFGVLFDRHADRIYNACFRRTANWVLAEDLTSIVFLEAWRGRSQAEPSGISAKPLLFGIASTVCHDPHRAIHNAKSILQKVPPPSGFEVSSNIDERVDAEREMSMFLRSTESLTQGERDALILCAVDKLEFADAAEALRIAYDVIAEQVASARAGRTKRYHIPTEQKLSSERFDARRTHLIEEIEGQRVRPIDTIPSPKLSRRWPKFVAAAAVIIVIAVGGIAVVRPIINKATITPAQALIMKSAAKTEAARTSQFSITYNFPQAKLAATGSYDYIAGIGKLNATVTDEAGKTKTYDGIVDHSTEYLTLDPGSVADGKTYLRQKLDDQSLDNSVFDPARLRRYLQTATPNSSKIGTESLRGVATTHYRTTLDFASAAERARDGRDGDFYRTQVDEFAVTPLPAEVWLDAEGRVCKLLLPNAGGKGAEFMGKQSFSIEYYDFGTAVEVKVPDTSLVTDTKPND